MFYEHVLKKVEGHNMVEKPKKGRKRPKPKYSILQNIDGYNKGEAHHPEAEKDQFQIIFFEATDYIVLPLKERFEQPTFVIYTTIDSLMAMVAPDHNSMKMAQENCYY